MTPVTNKLASTTPTGHETIRIGLEEHRLVDEQTKSLPDVIVPTSFNFPHTGKLLSISFILSRDGLPTPWCR